jgi:DNA helicase HerA-like ATPase
MFDVHGPEGPSATDVAQATWRKSSWSTYNGNCVEVAELRRDLIGIRDTKDAGAGPVLLFSDTAWRSFVARVKSGA